MTFLIVFGAGIAAGFLNVVAGGGSLITLPILTFTGMGIDVANGTNRIAILMQNIVAVNRFKKSKVLNLKIGLLLGIPAVLGSTFGSLTAVEINRDLLQKIVGLVLIAMAFFLIWKPKLWISERHLKPNPIVLFITFFGIGFYGGFIQAGVGFFFIFFIALLLGYDLVRTNAMKVLIILFYTPVALIIFLLNGKVDLLSGILLGFGNMVGAVLGAKFTVEKGSRWLRYIVFCAVIVSAVKYLL